MPQYHNSNKKMGNDFEREFCKMLSHFGFWVHNMAQNQAGQPADVIAVRNHRAYLIDCKVCTGRGFTLSRIEDNQELSMSLWKECGNGEAWFAFLINKEVYMLPLFTLLAYRNSGKSYISCKEIAEIGRYFDGWVRKCR